MPLCPRMFAFFFLCYPIWLSPTSRHPPSFTVLVFLFLFYPSKKKVILSLAFFSFRAASNKHTRSYQIILRGLLEERPLHSCAANRGGGCIASDASRALPQRASHPHLPPPHPTLSQDSCTGRWSWSVKVNEKGWRRELTDV